MNRMAGNLLALVAGLIGSLLLLEIVLRIAGFNAAETVPDPVIGYRFVPHARYRHAQEGASSGHFNADGWRDVEHALAKPPGTTRIEIVGDSYVSRSRCRSTAPSTAGSSAASSAAPRPGIASR
jgi:hypothetical protein